MNQEKKYPFTLPKRGIFFIKKYRKNLFKCANVAFSKNKHKTKGIVINNYMERFGNHLDHDNPGFIITVKYKTLDNQIKIGEQYTDLLENVLPLNSEVDLYYIDDNYDFIYIDDYQFIDPKTYIDSKEKKEQLMKEIKPIFISVTVCTILSLIATITLNFYLIIAASIIHFLFIVIILNLKCKFQNSTYLYTIPYLINIITSLVYAMNNANVVGIIACIPLILQLPVIIFLSLIKKKKT